MFREMDSGISDLRTAQGAYFEETWEKTNQSFEDLRAELESTRKQMNADTMEQIKSALRDHFSAV